MNDKRAVWLVCMVLAVSGCSAIENPPLIFASQQTLGASVSGDAAERSMELTLGFKGRELAVIPVTVKQANGSSQVQSSVGLGYTDALSVLGQFEATAGGEVDEQKAGTNVGLGKFFATGLAAQKLADGFAAKLGLRDQFGVSILPATVTVPENGTGNYEVKLDSKPSADVTVTVARASGASHDTDITVSSGASLTFTRSNWKHAQAVTIAAAEDNDHNDGTATIWHTASSWDTNYDGIVVGVTATEADND